MSSALQSTSTHRGGFPLDRESPVVVERKVKALLRQLTVERFDSISDQIVAWANKSEKEKDGLTLFIVSKLVFKKAIDEEPHSELYVRLCRKMIEKISPKVQDDGYKDSEGKPSAGGNLFRKYLLNICQEAFERGWSAKEATAATKATADKAVEEVNEKTKASEDSGLHSDEYYAAAKAKRRRLSLIHLFGELFKLQILTERAMHECIQKFLRNVENPEEEEIESVCKLLTTVGSLLDTPKARAHIDVYFSRMRELTKNKNVNAHMVSMLQDVIELRERKWIPLNAVAAPSTIAQVHEAAAKKKQAQEEHAFMRQNADKPSEGLGVTGPPESVPRRRKLQLLPRTRPVSEEAMVSTLAVPEAGPDGEAAGEGDTLAPAAISEGEATSKIDEDVKEFFDIRSLNKAESYFSSLPTKYRHRLVDTLVMTSIEMKEPDVKLVGNLFVRVREKGLCSPAVFEEGLLGLTELLDDLTFDIPKVWLYFVILLKASGLDEDEERYARIAKKTTDPDRLCAITGITITERHPDGWSVASQGSARPRPKAGDLSRFGKVDIVAPVSFAQTSPVSNKKDDPKGHDSPVSRTASSSNMSSILQSSDAIVDPPTSKTNRPRKGKPSVTPGVAGPPESVPRRRKLQLLPRTPPVGEEAKVSTLPLAVPEAGDTLAPVAISEGEAKSKIDEDVKKFFGTRVLDEAELYFSSLPTEYRHRLVDTLAMKSIEMKEPDVKLVGDLFVRVREKDLCSPAAFEDGLLGLTELLDDLADDIPKAWLYFAILLKGSGLDQDEERYARIAKKTMDPDRLNQLL